MAVLLLMCGLLVAATLPFVAVFGAEKLRHRRLVPVLLLLLAISAALITAGVLAATYL